MSAIDDLSEQTEELGTQVEILNGQVARLKRGALASFAAVIAVIVILGLVTFSGYQQLVTQNRLNSVVGDSLCPVFGLVLGGYDPNTRPPGQSRDTYEQTFQVMRDAYNNLNCTAPLVPPRQGA